MFADGRIVPDTIWQSGNLAIWQSGNLADGAYLEHVPGQSMWQQKKVEETELFQREMEEVMGKQNVIALAICNFVCVSNYLGERGRG